MKILVDADACPVKDIIETVAKSLSIEVIMFIDTNHVLSLSYAKVVTVGAEADAVDLALINSLSRGDIVVTQDFGVAALALGKGAYAISNSGMQFNEQNIETLLFERHISAKNRRSGGHNKGPRKRTSMDDTIFKENFIAICKKALISE